MDKSEAKNEFRIIPLGEKWQLVRGTNVLATLTREELIPIAHLGVEVVGLEAVQKYKAA